VFSFLRNKAVFFMLEALSSKKEYQAVVSLCYEAINSNLANCSKTKRKIHETYRLQAFKFLRSKENADWFCKISGVCFMEVLRFLQDFRLNNINL
jgi:flagellar basal body rod protein FlgC